MANGPPHDTGHMGVSDGCVEGEERDTVDLRPYGIGTAELQMLLRHIYTGQAAADTGDKPGELDPAAALALMPHAGAMLLEDLKRVCETVLVAVVDAGNAEALGKAAESCFAERLRVTCVDVLARVGPETTPVPSR